MYSSEKQPIKKSRSRSKQKLLSMAFNTGLIRLGRQFWSKSLTVLNYHRIDDLTRSDFDSFKPNVSASPLEFDRQMKYLKRWFNVITILDLVGWLEGRQNLPPFAALITFDDGYLDNYSFAFPILQKYGFGATIYLATGHIATDQPFFWDLAAYCFFHTYQDHVTFPNGRELTWSNLAERDQVLKSWVEALKILPEEEKQRLISKLPGQLSVSIPKDYFRNLMMSWNHVREMQNGGIAFGGHTVNHPILSRTTVEAAKTEITLSKLNIEKETGQPVLSFAYPNGMASDVNPEIVNIVKIAGYKTAFTLLNGPSLLREVRKDPFKIRRIFISNNHSLPEYAALVSPINRYRG